MAGGELREIQWIDVGSKVLSRCDKTGEIGYRKVSKRFEHLDVVTMDVVFKRDGRMYQIPIETTPEHRFYVRGKGWSEAGSLRDGDVVETSDGVGVTVDRIEILGGRRSVFNLEIEDFQTYFVGTNGVLVHDTNKPTIDE
jgi:hypothetical protein